MLRLPCSLLCLILCFNSHALKVGTYSTPPFSMNEDGEDIGMVTEAVRDLLAKSDIKNYKIINYPLARGIVELRYGRIDIFYPFITKLEINHENFKMIGPIAKYHLSLFVRKDYPADVSLTGMRNLVIAAERGSIGDMFLTTDNMHIERCTGESSCLRMALASRVSACAIGTLPGMYVAAINNIYQHFKYVDTGLYADMFVALGPSLSDTEAEAIQNTYAKLKKENYFDLKQKEYENRFKIFIDSLA